MIRDAFFCPFGYPICGSGTGITGSIVSAILQAISQWWQATAAWCLQLVAGLITTSTTPPVGARWFGAETLVLLRVAAPVALLALVGAAWFAVARGDLGVIVRTVLLRLPVAVLLAAAGAGLVAVALRATDALCAAIASGSGDSLRALLVEMAAEVATGGAVPFAVAGLVAFVCVLGALAVWLELVLRAAAITTLTAALPLVLAAALWPPGIAWARRVGEALGGLIVAKALVVLVLVVGLQALASSTGAAGLLTGAAMLLLAAFAPYAVLRLVPVAEAAALSHLEGLRQRASAAAVQVPRRAASLALGVSSGAVAPRVDAVGTDPVPMARGEAFDVTTGTALDPEATFARGRIPVTAVPASAGEHVWERDAYGPRLVWKPPWHVDD